MQHQEFLVVSLFYIMRNDIFGAILQGMFIILQTLKLAMGISRVEEGFSASSEQSSGLRSSIPPPIPPTSPIPDRSPSKDTPNAQHSASSEQESAQPDTSAQSMQRDGQPKLVKQSSSEQSYKPGTTTTTSKPTDTTKMGKEKAESAEKSGKTSSEPFSEVRKTIDSTSSIGQTPQSDFKTTCSRDESFRSGQPQWREQPGSQEPHIHKPGTTDSDAARVQKHGARPVSQAAGTAQQSQWASGTTERSLSTEKSAFEQTPSSRDSYSERGQPYTRQVTQPAATTSSESGKKVLSEKEKWLGGSQFGQEPNNESAFRQSETVSKARPSSDNVVKTKETSDRSGRPGLSRQPVTDQDSELGRHSEPARHQTVARTHSSECSRSSTTGTFTTASSAFSSR